MARVASLSLLLCGLLSAPLLMAEPTQVKDPISGFDYLSAPNQKLQRDEFANPGYFRVDSGKTLFNDASQGNACGDCHDAATMKDVTLKYPRHDAEADRLVNLSQQINECRVERQNREALEPESEEMLSLTAYLGNLSRGRTIDVTVTEETRPFFEQGREFYYRRRGQLNLSCAHCHEQSAGKRLRGEVISEGHSNGYPAYRHIWEALGSLHRMFQWCNEAVRAQPFDKGSEEYINLEYYLKWRGNGLTVETPAVRR